MDDSDIDEIQNVERSENDDEFWQLVATTTGTICTYYYKYIYKEPCMDSYQTGIRWLSEIMQGHKNRCVNMFRMNKDTLLGLCNELKSKYGLKPSRRMSVIEKVCMFLWTIAIGASNRQVQERFQHSGETVSRKFGQVLSALKLFAANLIKPIDPEFKDIPPEILHDTRYMPHFKVISCII